MSALLGILNLADSHRTVINDIGQALVFDAVGQTLEMHNTEVNRMIATFIDRKVEVYSERYLLPAVGYLQDMGQEPLAPPLAMKAAGYYTVAYPLRSYGGAIGMSRVADGYLTVGELDRQLDGIMQADLDTFRLRILISLMEDTNYPFVDRLYSDLTICRLANTDGTSYPPVLGSVTEEDDQHYTETATGYTVSDIADAKNPVVTSRDAITEHFGGWHAAGERMVYFHGSDQTYYLRLLTGFIAVGDFAVKYGADTSLAGRIPDCPGEVHGRVNGCWLSEWTHMPDTYGMAVHLDMPPLRMRVDPGNTGLGAGNLQLVAGDAVDYPLKSSYWERRFGLGVANRLSAYCIEISGGNTTYTPPSEYAEGP